MQNPFKKRRKKMYLEEINVPEDEGELFRVFNREEENVRE